MRGSWVHNRIFLATASALTVLFAVTTSPAISPGIAPRADDKGEIPVKVVLKVTRREVQTVGPHGTLFGESAGIRTSRECNVR